MHQFFTGRASRQMILARALRSAAVAALAAAALGLAPAMAQDVAPEIENRSDRLDVPYVPSTNEVLDVMFEFARPTKEDYVMDLGSGDGRIVNYAVSKFGARGHGIDLNEGLVKIANDNARRAGIADRAKFYVRDLFKEDLSKATVITMYLLPEVMMQIRPQLFRLKPGTRIVSHDYHMANWRFDGAKPVPKTAGGDGDVVYYWKVPAKIAGTWEWKTGYAPLFQGERSYKAQITQRFQDFEGRLDTGVLPMRIYKQAIDGAKVSFSVSGEIEDRVVRQDFEGVVDGNQIKGTVTLSGPIETKVFPWTATRTKAEN
ncbi:MAG: hypothetical protein RL477_1728 [Pseudomonadota bacterium]|jgi:methylase of polypeptide subunit release factors